MRKLLLIILLTVCCLSTYAQDYLHVIDLYRNEKLVEFTYLNDKGFILKTDKKILSFSQEGRLIWEKQFENHPTIRGENIMVAAPDASIIYNLEFNPYRFAGKKQYITQIKQIGELKTFEITMGEDYGKNLQSVFCDEQYLYYLATENGDEFNDKKKVEEKLIMHRFSHNGLTHKKIVLNLPEITEPETTSFWSYAGQNKQGKYLVSKRLRPETNEQAFDLISIDAEGKVIKKTVINYGTGDRYIRPASCLSWSEGLKSNVGSHNLVNMSFEIFLAKDIASNKGPVSFKYDPASAAGGPPPINFYNDKLGLTNASFGYLQLDETYKEGAFYVYGLLGPRPFRNVSPGYEGFYVYKYDLDGKQIWKLHNASSEALMNSKPYTTHALPRSRFIGLITHPNQSQTFSISNLSFKADMFTFQISEQGIVTQMHSTDGKSEESTQIVALTPKAKSYIKKQSFKKYEEVSYSSFITPSGEVLLLTNKWEKKLNVLFFKN